METTVLIVDDHAGFRTSARAMLEAEGFQVVGEAGTGTAAVAAASRLRPAVVLLDVRLPDLDGFEVARQLAGLADLVCPTTRRPTGGCSPCSPTCATPADRSG